LEQKNELDLVEALVEHLIYEHTKHFPRDPKEYWVVDLTRCSKKREFELLYPELTWFYTFSPRLITGELIHKGLEHLIENELIFDPPLKVHVELEFEKTLDLNGSTVTIVGRPDLTFENKDEIEAVVDIKCVTALRDVPYEHHVLQIALYKFLSDASLGYILYVSPKGFSQRKVDDTATHDDVRRLITEEKVPRYTWECGYCAYSSFCSSAIRRRGGKS